MNKTPALILDNITLNYGSRSVLQNFSLQLQSGEIGCLLGASGCGKTTALRTIAGFEIPTQGKIQIRGNTVYHQGQSSLPEHRKVGMVFQDYALFPHLNVKDNIAFGLHAMSRPEKKSRVSEILDLVGLHGFEARFPHQLSGGQQQRVALARALAPSPQLLLLDEPFSNLDVALRERLAHEVRAIIKQTGTTAMLVTHDQHEAFAMADVVGVMEAGQIRQWASPYDLYHLPANRFVANFIGEGVFLPARLISEYCLEFALGQICRLEALPHAIGSSLDVLIRPDDVQHVDSSLIKGIVRAKAFRGAVFLYTLELSNGEKLLSLVPSHHDHAIGEAIGIEMALDHVSVFERG